MTKNQTAQYKLPVNIIHLEDMDDWLTIISETVTADPSKGYKSYQCQTVEELIKLLTKYPYLSILVVDLNLQQRAQDDFQGLAWLLRNIVALRTNQIEIFIVSGLLNTTNQYLFQYNEIPASHVHSKHLFEDDAFLAAIDSAADRLRQNFIKQWQLRQAPPTSICKIEAHMVNVDTFDNIYQVEQGHTYLLEVSILSLPYIKQTPDSVNQLLKVYIHSVESNVDPEIQTLPLPDVYELRRIRFSVTFSLIEAPPLRDLIIAIYYQNNLLRLLEYRVKVHSNNPNSNPDSPKVIEMSYK